MPLFVTVTPGTTVTNTTTLDATVLNLLGTPAIDVTGTVDGGSLSLSGGSVGTNELSDNAVTNTKLADMTGPSVKGRQTGTGDPQDVTIDNSTVEIATVSSSPTLRLKDGGVSYAKIQNTVNGSRLIGRAATAGGTIGEIEVGSGLSLSVGGVLSSSIPFVGFWQDGTPQTVPASGATLTRSHGLGYAPNFIDAYLFCDDAGGSNGYANGDLVHHSLFQLVTGSEARQAFYLFLDVSNGNNILCKRGASLPGSIDTGISIPNKTTGVFSSPLTTAELAKWKIVMKAVRFS
jgi:hypothetical protein